MNANKYASNRVYLSKEDFKVKWGFIGKTPRGQIRLKGTCGHTIDVHQKLFEANKVNPVCGKCEAEYFDAYYASLPKCDKEGVDRLAQELASVFKFNSDVEFQIEEAKNQGVFIEQRWVRHYLSNYDSEFQPLLNADQKGDILIYKMARKLVDAQISALVKLAVFGVVRPTKKILTKR